MPLPNPDTAELIRIYKKAQARIAQKIIEAGETGNITVLFYQQRLLEQINRELARLQQQTAQWVESNMPLAYQRGVVIADQQIASQFKAAGVAPPVFPSEFGIIDREQILSLVNATQNTFNGVIEFTGSQLSTSINEAVADAIRDKISTGETLRQAQATIATNLELRGIQAVEIIRNGRTTHMQLDHYASMVARSTTAEATNQAVLRRVVDVNGDLVKMSTHLGACPICFPLQGRVYSITGNTPGYPRLEVAYSGGFANIHPNCVLPGTVVSGPPLLSHISRRYEGEIIVIHMAGGKELSITPEHPIMTPKGWVNAGLLKEGDQVVKHTGEKFIVDAMNPYKKHIPIVVEDVPGALWKPGEAVSASVPVSPHDFHGDGANSEVCIIRTNRLLLTKHNISLSKKIREYHLKRRNEKLSLFSRFRPLALFLKRNFPAFCGLVGVFGKLLSFINRHSFKPVFAGLASRFGRGNARLLEPSADGHSSNAKPFGDSFFGHSTLVQGNNLVNWKIKFILSCFRMNNWAQLREFKSYFRRMFLKRGIADIENGRYLLDSLAGEVEFLDIIKVDRVDFTGHVYNLQTTENWFASNCIIVSNCKHRIFPYIPELKSPAEIKKDQAFSNQPLETENMSPAVQKIYARQLKAYNAGQAKGRDVYFNREQWKRYLARMGSDAPQTFSGFMRIKNANSESYQNLRADYRAAGIKLKEEQGE
ncbi:hypothetical protein KAR91_49280 [Candidatus Pacearchaeota archaeon]|nr:hypothetical protein [Candidatus Pacearchaeota archaeon]